MQYNLKKGAINTVKKTIEIVTATFVVALGVLTNISCRADLGQLGNPASATKVTIGDDGFRRWDNGSSACSCNEYKNPKDSKYEGSIESGLYKIQPYGATEPLSVYCDMQTDGGGWTLVLLNSGYPITPSPDWETAIKGNTIEGNMKDDILMGFDQLVGLAYWQNIGENLRVEVGTGPNGISHRAQYYFALDRVNNYTLRLTNEKILIGNNSPGLFLNHNNRPFTTKDKDNDTHSSVNCAVNNSNSPWWYYNCWDGNFWGGGTNGSSAQNKAYWTGWTTDCYYWGAFWIK